MNTHQKPMRILILDLDGVINHISPITGQWTNFPADTLGCVKRIISATGCKIILSSSWREDQQNLNHASAIFERFLEPIFDLTPILKCKVDFNAPDVLSGLYEPVSVTRTKEIKLWFQSQKNDGVTIDSWCAVDDWKLDLPTSNFIRTDWKIGITPEQADRVIEILNRQ